MKKEKVFRTKTGFCHITQDEIILTRDGVAGNVAKLIVGNKIPRILVIYSLFAIYLGFMIFKGYQSNEGFKMLFPVVILFFLLYGILTSLNNSATPIIQRSKIQEVKFKKGVKGITRAVFEIYFLDENGKRKKRLVFLTGSLSGGEDETQKALKIMREENLLADFSTGH